MWIKNKIGCIVNLNMVENIVYIKFINSNIITYKVVAEFPQKSVEITGFDTEQEAKDYIQILYYDLKNDK